MMIFPWRPLKIQNEEKYTKNLHISEKLANLGTSKMHFCSKAFTTYTMYEKYIRIDVHVKGPYDLLPLAVPQTP